MGAVCNGKRGNLPSRGKCKCWRVQKSLPYAGTMLQYLIFKICFRLSGFRSRPLPEFHSSTPCSATPTFPSTPPWGISCGRPGLVNILSFSYKFILNARFFRGKKIVRLILDLCVVINWIFTLHPLFRTLVKKLALKGPKFNTFRVKNEL